MVLTPISMVEALEEPKYDLIRSFEGFEIRHYTDTIQARIATTDSNSKAPSKGFRTIAGYIFGSNNSGQKIKMTAPVHIWRDQGVMNMAFTMPSEHNLSDLPVPINSSIQIVPVAGELTAAMKFSGFYGEKKTEKLSKKLFSMISNHNLEPIGPSILAVYDNPMTLPFLRRNEILIPLKDNF